MRRLTAGATGRHPEPVEQPLQDLRRQAFFPVFQVMAHLVMP